MLASFYSSEAWAKARHLARVTNIEKHGELTCELCGKPILISRDCVIHHKIPVTDENMNDVNITLNPDNLMVLDWRCHERIHERGWVGLKKIYLIVGDTKQGLELAHKARKKGDLIVDTDSLWRAFTGLDTPDKEQEKRLLDDVMRTRNFLIDRLVMRAGDWKVAWITFDPRFTGEKERLQKKLGAELIELEE